MVSEKRMYKYSEAISKRKEAKREEKNRNDAEKVKSLKGKQSNDAFVC